MNDVINNMVTAGGDSMSNNNNRNPLSLVLIVYSGIVRYNIRN